MSEPRQKKRQRQTLVCEFCRKRKVKCDKGNPCSTCKKYGNVNCHYSDNMFQMISGNTFVEQNHMGDTNYMVKTSPNGNGVGALRKSSDSSVKSDLELELESLKQKIKSIEQSVTSIATSDLSPNSIQSNSSSTQYGLPSLDTPTLADPLTISSHWKDKSMLGRNPVASNYDTINFYTGYTSVQDKEPLRRANFGPMSWIALLRKDRASNMLWSYVEGRRKLIEDKLKVFQTTNASTKTEHHFKDLLTESFGYNDVKLFKAKTGDRNMKFENGNDYGLDVVNSPVSRQLSNTTTKSELNSKPRLFSNNYNVNDSAAKSKINERARSLGISFYAGDIDDELALADKIELILPNESVIWLLVGRFFTHIYPFYPVIDEVSFRANVSAIIGLEGYDNKKKVSINVEKKLDFANLGLLLLMLRFSYLSLLSTIESVNERNLNTADQSPEAQRLKFLLNNPINLEIVDCAQECLNQFNLLRRVNMTIMQLALFTRLYHMYAPEDGDSADGGDSQVFTATLVQMALSLGLNREPDLFPDACNDEKVNNIGRKIWYLLLIFDFNNAMALGTPLNISRSMFDTKFPFYKHGNSNILDTELEMKILSSSFPRMDRVYGPMFDIITTVLDVRGNINMASLAEKLNFVETYFNQEYGNLRSIFDDASVDGEEESDSEDLFVKTLKMKIYFASNFFLVTIYFHFFCYYENKKNSEYAYYYLKKIFSIIIGELVPYYLELLGNNPKIFRNSTDMIVIPSFEIILHKSLIICSAILIRIRLMLYTLKVNPNHDMSLLKDQRYSDMFSKLTKMDQLLQKSCKIFLETVGRLSKRYYYAWRIVKAGGFIHDLVKGKEFYEHLLENTTMENTGDGGEDVKDKKSLLDMKFSIEMLDDLIVLFEESLARVPRHKKMQTQQNQQTYQQQQRQYGQQNQPSDNSYNPQQSQNPDGSLITHGSTQRSNGSMSNSNNDSSGSLNGEAHSVGSTGSSSYSENFSAGNESVDRLWLQMLQLKRKDLNNSNLGMTPSFDFFNQTPVENARYQAETPGAFGLKGVNGEFLNDAGTGTGFDSGLNVMDHSLNELMKSSDFDLFQSLTFEDIWGKNM
ncbi:multidrug resistance regulator 1 [[Candida] railenensis]|uniref:Multidrug resistance regulator 1 n=1 Tax=[Candida] railenensis TaxID=45579 RepID=A0A9P0W0T3_9ASCO|nr:multidrug resistance regulator 1 [[Candida] railenensis]